MSHEETITNCIKRAMTSACEQMVKMTDRPEERISAEYMFTAATANAIANENGHPADPFIVRVEHDAATFATNCLKPLKLRSPKLIRRTKQDAGREGRIDVAIYSDVPNSGHWDVKPVCAIELKGFDPTKPAVMADLRRNLRYHRVSGPTGSSDIEFTVFAAFHSYLSSLDRHLPKKLNIAKRRYERYMQSLGPLQDIDYSIDPFTVSSDISGRIIDNGEYAEIDTSTRHHFVGVIVVLRPRAVSNQGSPASLARD